MKRSKIVGVAALAALAFAVSGLAAGYEDNVQTNKQIMAKINGGSKGLFNVVKKGLSGSDQDWAALKKQTQEIVTLTEGFAKNSPMKGSSASWEKLTGAFTENAKALADAADKMDLKAAKTAQQAMVSSCMPCHRMHK